MRDIQERTQALLDEIVSDRPEVGLQVAAYHHGELIADAWSGVADVQTGRAIDADTVFVTASVSKGVLATVVHLLAERGQLDYDAPIADVWRGFERHGKAGVTTRHVLSHSAGLAHLPLDVTPSDVVDWDRMCAILADSTPAWTPGMKTGYHALTFGWLLGEVVRRVDGRPVDQVLAEDVCAPLGLDSLWFGMPESAASRLARTDFIDPPPPPTSPNNTAPTIGDADAAYAASAVPPGLLPLGALVNRPEFPRAVVPAAGGVANARSLARLYASLIGDGVDGRRLLPETRVRTATTLQTEAVDVVVGVAWPKAMGYFLGFEPAVQTCISPTAFGHTGAGGFTAFADPARDLAFAVCKTHMLSVIDRIDDPARRFERLLHELLPG